MFARCFGSDWTLGITFPESWPCHGISCCGYLNRAGAKPFNSHSRPGLVRLAPSRFFLAVHEQYTCTPLRDVALFVDSRAMREVLLGALSWFGRKAWTEPQK